MREGCAPSRCALPLGVAGGISMELDVDAARAAWVEKKNPEGSGVGNKKVAHT